MPYTKPASLKRVRLTSDPSYWVDWRTSVRYGDIRQATKKAVTITNGESEVDTSVYADYVLLAYIADWNLDDENGAKLPITPESLALLTLEDSNQLAALLTEETEQKDKKRKR